MRARSGAVGGIDLREREPGRDVLGAVPVEGLDGDQQPSLGMSAVTREHEVVVQKGIVALYDARTAEKLQPGLVQVVHEEQRHAVVIDHVADADVLAIAAEVGEADGLLIEDAHEAGRSAAVLDVGPTCFAHGRHVDAVASCDERGLGLSERCVAHRGSVHAGIGLPAAHGFLHGPDGRGEGDVCETMAHGFPPGAAGATAHLRDPTWLSFPLAIISGLFNSLF